MEYPELNIFPLIQEVAEELSKYSKIAVWATVGTIKSGKYKEEILYLNKNNVFGGEVYIKIINDSDIYKGDYYWYVALISRNGGTLSMIISPYSKDVLAVNNTIEKIS